jgi:hypothetical protein
MGATAVYFVGLAATSILFDTPLVILFHCTEVAEGVAMTTHCSVKTDRHDITEILLKVVLSTIDQTKLEFF